MSKGNPQVAPAVVTEVATVTEVAPVGKPLVAVVDFIAKAVEYGGLDAAIAMVLNRHQRLTTAEGALSTIEEVKGALKALPAFKRFFVEEIRQKALTAMASPEYQVLVARIEEARQALDAAQNAAEQHLQDIAGIEGYFTLNNGVLAPVVQDKTPVATSGRGRRYTPKLDRYSWNKNNVVLVLEKTDHVWSVTADGVKVAASASYTEAVKAVYASVFGLEGNISVPREVQMREQESAIGLATG